MHHGDTKLAYLVDHCKGYIIDMLHDNKESYFLTITLKPKLYQFTTVTQFELTHSDIVTMLDAACKDYVIVTEFTKSANIHYHALVTFTSPTHRISLINKLKKNRLLGFTKFDPQPIRSSIRVCDYMTKDLYVTLQCFPPNLRWKVAYNITDSLVFRK